MWNITPFDSLTVILVYEEGGSGQLPPSSLMGVLISFNSKFLSGTTDNTPFTR
ncbi:hypothetical protein [Barnesiella intestinihominis]|uniref:hypothetical protein n=1 Tax=Barnesiella intestinihominis TaxID=487174 RepID=UPI0039704CDD